MIWNMQWNYCSTSACALLLLKKENKKLATNWALWMDFEAQARFSFSVYHHLLDISQWNLKRSQLWTFKYSKTKLFIFQSHAFKTLKETTGNALAWVQRVHKTVDLLQLLILRLKAPFYRTYCTRRSKFLTHALNYNYILN